MSSIRRQRRSRVRNGGLTLAQVWELTVPLNVPSCLVPADGKVFKNDQEARAAWRKHRGRFMAERHPGQVPAGLIDHEPESFASAETVRLLRLDNDALRHCATEFGCLASWHRRNGRVELAADLDRRKDVVKQVLSELEAATA